MTTYIEKNNKKKNKMVKKKNVIIVVKSFINTRSENIPASKNAE